MRIFLLSFILSLSVFSSSQIDSTNQGELDTLTGLYVSEIVETSPEFPGGHSAMIKYIFENISFQGIIIDDWLSVVYIQFIIDKLGKVRGVRALLNKDHPIAINCVEVLSKMPDWTPGKNNGEPVNVKYTIPLRIHPQK